MVYLDLSTNQIYGLAIQKKHLAIWNGLLSNTFKGSEQALFRFV